MRGMVDYLQRKGAVIQVFDFSDMDRHDAIRRKLRDLFQQEADKRNGSGVESKLDMHVVVVDSRMAIVFLEFYELGFGKSVVVTYEPGADLNDHFVVHLDAIVPWGTGEIKEMRELSFASQQLSESKELPDEVITCIKAALELEKLPIPEERDAVPSCMPG